jgi:hypothetical protein
MKYLHFQPRPERLFQHQNILSETDDYKLNIDFLGF